jgi:hypothetical protein
LTLISNESACIHWCAFFPASTTLLESMQNLFIPWDVYIIKQKVLTSLCNFMQSYFKLVMLSILVRLKKKHSSDLIFISARVLFDEKSHRPAFPIFEIRTKKVFLSSICNFFAKVSRALGYNFEIFLKLNSGRKAKNYFLLKCIFIVWYDRETECDRHLKFYYINFLDYWHNKATCMKCLKVVLNEVFF